MPSTVDTAAKATAAEVAAAAAGVERDRAAEPGEAPLSEWEAHRMRPHPGEPPGQPVDLGAQVHF